MGLVAAVATIGMGIVNSIQNADAQGAAQKQANQTQQMEQNQINDANAQLQQQKDLNQSNATRDAQLQKVLAAAGAGSGQNGTILTGPMGSTPSGVPGLGTVGGKTLLGA